MTALQWLTVAALSPLIIWALMYLICFALMTVGFVYGKVMRWHRKRKARTTDQNTTR